MLFWPAGKSNSDTVIECVTDTVTLQVNDIIIVKTTFDGTILCGGVEILCTDMLTALYYGTPTHIFEFKLICTSTSKRDQCK